jgi:hypothetical protein
MTNVYDEFTISPRLGADPHAEIYKQGHPREGWINFELYEFVEFPNAEFKILLKDSLGGQHWIRREPQVYKRTGELIATAVPAHQLPNS